MDSNSIAIKKKNKLSIICATERDHGCLHCDRRRMILVKYLGGTHATYCLKMTKTMPCGVTHRSVWGVSMHIARAIALASGMGCLATRLLFL